MPERIGRAFRGQAKACRELGSPFTARLCELFADRPIPAPRLAAAAYGWPGDPTAAGENLPLRLLGALHALVLDRLAPDLAAVYPPSETACNDDALWAAIAAALAAHEDFMLGRLAVAPQTNEVARSGALLPGFLAIARHCGLPLVVSEIGASAGLNLLWDVWGYRLGDRTWGDAASPVQLEPDWRGEPAPDAAIAVLERAGCDVAPLDPGNPADRTRLLSFIWANQRDRLARIRAALAVAADRPVRVARAAAGDWLEERLRQARPGAVHVVCHSIVWQYLSAEDRDRCRAAIAAAGARAAGGAPLAWLRMEVDGQRPGAALSLTVWPDGTEHALGRADFHGRWVDWRGLPENGARRVARKD
ncbi:MAG: DUF2332 family protein [Alphaproteobacteria bacterium]|nr:DUF2332 family protein [Alphaproteobacteria bacterium]